MDHGNLDKAMEIFTLLIVGEEVSSAQHVDLYEAYQNNSEVYDILMSVLKKSNLSLYEFGSSLYVTSGDGNRVFGFTFSSHLVQCRPVSYRSSASIMRQEILNAAKKR